MKRFLLLGLIFGVVYAQNVAELQQKINAGQSEDVKKQLPALLSQYPANPELLYLSGVLEADGEAALLIYRNVLSRYPNSSVADDAFLKIIEYLFTKGLYAKTDKYAREFLRTYPRSDLIDRAVYLQLCSLSARNQRDSVDYYYQYYSQHYPGMDFHFANYRSASSLALVETSDRMRDNKSSADQSARLPAPASHLPASAAKPKTSENGSAAGRYTLQMGVFGNPANARTLRLQLERIGYPVELKKIQSSGRMLTVVLTGSFMTETEARTIGAKLKRENKLDFVVVRK